MAYVPDPTDVTQPIESVFASTAAAEFRALKAYIQGLVVGSGQLAGYRNVVRNGSALINQRNVAIANAAGLYPADGWRLQESAPHRMSVAKDTVNHAGTFPSDFSISVPVPGVPIGAEFSLLSTGIIGYDIGRFLYGTVNARVGTLSFRVFSSLTGQFSMSLRNGASTRSCVVPFNVDAPNTWEYKTIQVPGDTAGAWVGTAALGLLISFAGGAGPTFQTATPSVWQAGNLLALTTQQQLVSGANALYLAEVQFEQSSFATPFEEPGFLARLDQARDYYQTSYEYGISPGAITTSLGTSRGVGNDASNVLVMRDYYKTMRAAPGGYVIYNPVSGVISAMRNTQTGASIGINVGVGANSNGAYILSTAGLTVAGQLYEWNYTAESEII